MLIKMWYILCILSFFLYFELLSRIIQFLRPRSKSSGLPELQMSGRLSENINALLTSGMRRRRNPLKSSPGSLLVPNNVLAGAPADGQRSLTKAELLLPT